MELTQDHRDALQDILLWRRDVRHFLPDPIPQAVLDRLRKAMDFAPSVGNARPWRVLHVKSAERRNAVIANFEAANAKAAERYQGDQRTAYNDLKLAYCARRPFTLRYLPKRNPKPDTA
ncbi:nitroreductase family protein [Yoonia sp. GPGPB17]|uniref:nitroreductase family protein n=1 Tax=Yoonia sp. GPGPB17 TaxID=3026147 RepID=UPI0030EE31B7